MKYFVWACSLALMGCATVPPPRIDIPVRPQIKAYRGMGESGKDFICMTIADAAILQQWVEDVEALQTKK